MKILDMKEDVGDGGGMCEMDVEFEEGEVKILLNWAVNEALRRFIEDEK
jgi:hypothetical protein